MLNGVAAFNTAMDAYMDVNSFRRLAHEMGDANDAIAALVTGNSASLPTPALLVLVNAATKEVNDVVDCVFLRT